MATIKADDGGAGKLVSTYIHFYMTCSGKCYGPYDVNYRVNEKKMGANK